jgi:hypothetical protein
MKNGAGEVRADRLKHFDAILFWGTGSPTLKWYSGITTRISYPRARVQRSNYGPVASSPAQERV